MRIAGRPSPISSGCDGDMQPIQQIRLQKRGYGHAAALHEHATATQRAQLAQQIHQVQRAIAGVHFQDLLAPGARLRDRRAAAGADSPGERGPVVEHGMRRRQSAGGIEDHAHRIAAGHQACGQTWIVGGHGAGTDDHGIAQRAQPMQVQDVLRTGNRDGISGWRGDEAIEALAQVTDGDGPGGRRTADRQVQLEQIAARITGRQCGLPPRCRIPAQHRRGIIRRDADELPRLGEREARRAVGIEAADRLGSSVGDGPGIRRCGNGIFHDDAPSCLSDIRPVQLNSLTAAAASGGCAVSFKLLTRLMFYWSPITSRMNACRFGHGGSRSWRSSVSSPAPHCH